MMGSIESTAKSTREWIRWHGELAEESWEAQRWTTVTARYICAWATAVPAAVAVEWSTKRHCQ